TSPSGSSRPLSKVRTNFVAVEKDGRVGLKRHESGESSISGRLPTPDLADDRKHDTREPERGTTWSEVIVKTSREEVPHLDIPVDATMNSGERAVVEESTLVYIPETPNFDRESDLQIDDEYEREISSLPQAKGTKDTNSNSHTNVEVNADFSTGTAPGHTTGPHSASSTSSRPTINKSKENTRKPPDCKPIGHKLKVVTTATMKSSLRAKTIPASSEVPCSRQPVGLRPQRSNKFFEKKPTAPTDPVYQPSSLMAPTVSSVSRVHGSQNRQGTKPIISTSSQAHANPGASSLSSSSHITQRHSSASSLRPSIAPPGKCLQTAATSKRPSDIDEGFLARMMRPTRSSASKSADKVIATPSKRTCQPSAERKGSGSSDRAFARSVSSRCSHNMPAIELTDRNSPSNIEVAHVVDVTKTKECTTRDNDHEPLDAVVDISQPADPQTTSEGTSVIIVRPTESVFGTSATTTVRYSSEMDQTRDSVKSCRQDCVLDMESVSASRNGECQSTRTVGPTYSEASVLLTAPGKITSDEHDVLLQGIEQESPSSNQSFLAKSSIGSNAGFEEGTRERAADTNQTVIEKPGLAFVERIATLSDPEPSSQM
ncbi:hypothetical protein E4U41_006117, partial [Claviceps citrina]